MMQSAEKHYTASIENIPARVEFVAEKAEAAGVHPKRVMHLQLATEEAVANICNYAYEVPPGELSIRISPTEHALQIDFIDNGVPFDPLSKEAPDLQSELDKREIGGLGIFLIRRFLDEVHYKRQGDKNILSLVVKHEVG